MKNLVGMNDIEGGDRRDPKFLLMTDGGAGPRAQDQRKGQVGPGIQRTRGADPSVGRRFPLGAPRRGPELEAEAQHVQ